MNRLVQERTAARAFEVYVGTDAIWESKLVAACNKTRKMQQFRALVKSQQPSLSGSWAISYARLQSVGLSVATMLGLPRSKSPRLLDMLKAFKAGGEIQRFRRPK